MVVDWQNISAMDWINGLAWAILVAVFIRHGYQLFSSRRKLNALRRQQEALDHRVNTETRNLKQLVDAFNIDEDPNETRTD